MFPILIFSASILLQAIASVLALRLIPTTRGWTAWLLIASALLLIVVRRTVHLAAILTGIDAIGPSEFFEDILFFVTSVLLVAGIWFIRPLFVRMVQDREALRQQVEELETVMAVAPAVILVAHDPHCHRITGNRAACEVYGVPSETNVSQTPMPGMATTGLRYFQDGRELPPQELPVQTVAASGTAIRGAEIEIVRPDGTRLVVLGNASPLRGAAGEVRGVVAAFVDVTDHRRAEDALRKAKDELEQRVLERTAELSQSREKLAKLFSSSPIGIFLTRAQDGRILEANQACLRTLGYSAEELVGSIPQDLNLFKDWDDRKRLMETLRTEGRITNCHVEYRHKSGRILTVLVNALPLDVDGVSCVLGTLLDITDHVRAEGTLRESQARMKAILDTIPDTVWMKDRQGRFLAVNAAWCRVMGVAPEQALGKTVGDFEPQDQARTYTEQDSEVIRSGRQVVYDQTTIGGDGQPRYAESIKSPLVDGEGNIIGTVGISRDITERKRAEEALRKSEEWHRTVLRTAMDGFWLADMQGRLLEVNESYCRMSGYSKEELLTMRIADLEAGETPADTAAHNQKIMTLGEDRFESQHRRSDQSLFDVEVSVQYRPVDGGQFVMFCRDISERKRADKALRESQAKLETALASMTDAVFISDAHGRFIEFNDAAVTFHKFKNRAQCPTTFAEYPDILDMVQPDGTSLPLDMWLVPRALRGETATNAEYTLRRKDTGETWVGSYSFAPIRGNDGVIVGSVVVGRDVTDRKRAEEALRQSEARMKTILDTIADPVWMKDQEDRFVAVNAAWCQINGATQEEALGKTVFDLYPEEVARAYTEQNLQIARSGRRLTGERAFVGIDGLWHYYETVKSPLMDGQGKTVGIVGISRNMTDRKRAEEALRQSEARYRNLFETMTEGFSLNEILCDEAGKPCDFRYLVANPAFERHTGRKASEIIGRTFRDLFPDAEPVWIEQYGKVALTGEPAHFEAAFGPLGRWFEISVFRAEPSRFAVVFQDITDRKRTAEELRSANTALERSAEQLRGLTLELTHVEQRERRQMADILHDHLQQLLVAAKLNVMAMTQGPLEIAERDSARKANAALDEAIAQSKSLVMELSPPVLREGGLGHALQWLGRRMHDLQGLAVHVEAGDADGRVDEDLRIVLFSAVRELLFNVVKHAKVSSARVELSLLPDNQVQIVVADDGAGFASDNVKSNARTHGGFGLFAIRERLESLGGRLHIDSRPAGGSRITLTAPVHPSAPAAGQDHDAPATEKVAAAAPKHRKSGARIRVLLADDHVMMRQGISQLLAQTPDVEVVGEASDGQEAVRLAQDIRPDVVVMDVNMPTMNGIEATRAIRAKVPGVVVVALSMYAEAHRAEEMRQAGAAAYIAKSDVADALVTAIHACCAR